MKVLLDKRGDWGLPEDSHEKFMLPAEAWINQHDAFFDFISTWSSYGHKEMEHWERGILYKRSLYEQAYKLASSTYLTSYPNVTFKWELRFQPHVGAYYIPDPDSEIGWFALYFVFKFDNNGTSIIVYHKDEPQRKNPLPGVIVGYETEEKVRLSK